MRKILLILLLFCSFLLQAQTFKIGLTFQKTNEMYWENGISAQYSLAKFKPDQFFIGFDFASSRFGTAINSNAIKQDNYTLSGSWHFNKSKPYHFVTRLNLSYFYSDLEYAVFEDIPNTAFFLAPEVGFTYDFNKIPISLNLGMGYRILTANEGYSPGTLQPLFYHLDIYYVLFKNAKK